MDRASCEHPHVANFDPVAGLHFLRIEEPGPSQQCAAVPWGENSRLLTEQFQGEQVQVVVMKVRDEHRVNAARWRLEDMRVAMNQATDPWLQERIGQQPSAAQFDQSCRVSKVDNS
jgi:hypothetical protein